MATEFPKCGRHYLLKFHLTVTSLKRSYQNSTSLLKQSVLSCSCCPAPQSKPCGEAPLCNQCSWWTPPAPGGRGSVLCELRAGLSCHSAPFPPPWLQESGWSSHHCVCSPAHGVQCAPVKTVRSSRLWLCGFLLDVLLWGRYSDPSASF